MILYLKIMLLSPSSFCSLHDRPVNWEMNFGARNDDFNRKARKLRRRQTSISKNRLLSVKIHGPFIYARGGEGLPVASISGRAGLSTGCWLTIAYLVGRRGPLGCLTNSWVRLFSWCLYQRNMKARAREGKALYALGSTWGHHYNKCFHQKETDL